MFDFLESSSADQLIPAGYNAIQFIRQWARASVAAGKYASFEALPPKQVELAKRIVAEIEAREGQPVVAIPLLKIDEYIKIIGRKLLERSLTDLHADEDRGKILLDELRLSPKESPGNALRGGLANFCSVMTKHRLAARLATFRRKIPKLSSMFSAKLA